MQNTFTERGAGADKMLRGKRPVCDIPHAAPGHAQFTPGPILRLDQRDDKAPACGLARSEKPSRPCSHNNEINMLHMIYPLFLPALRRFLTPCRNMSTRTAQTFLFSEKDLIL